MSTISHIGEKRGTALYEPVFDLETSWVVGVEAVSPAPSTPQGPGTVQAALIALAALPSRTFVSVRLAPDAVGRLALMLDEHWLPRVVVHLDGDDIEDPGALAARVAGFRDRGGRLALDVGAGPASLGRVAALEPDVIELNASVTDGIDADRSRRLTAVGLVALGEQTGSRVLAQEICTAGELAALRGMGVAFGRGPLLAEPFPLDQLLPDLPPPDAA